MGRIIKTPKTNTMNIIILLFVLFVIYQITKAVLSICSSQLSGDDFYLLIFRTLVVIGVSFAVLLSAYSLLNKNIDGEQVAFICFVFGMFFMFLITPLAPPDEGSHFEVSYLYSNRILNLGTQTYTANQTDFDYTMFEGHHNMRNGYIWLIYGFNDPYVDGGSTHISDTMWTFKYFLEYVPQALGLSIARLFHANQVWTFYSGRFANLLFYTLCVFFAVKTAPVYKAMLSLTALLPISLQQAASYSSDAFINGIALIYIALIIKLTKQEEIISAKDMILTVVSIAALSPAKVAYSPLVLLLFMIPCKNFKSKKQRWTFIIAGFAACILMLCAFSLPTLCDMMSSSADNKLSDTYPFTFILEHPIKTLSIFISTLFVNSGEYWNEALGIYLGGSSIFVPRWIILVYTILLLLSATRIQNTKFIELNIKNRVYLFLSALFVVFMIMAMEFIGWTTYGCSIVCGIQGRYFIPIIPVLLLLIDNGLVSLSKNVDKYLLLSSELLTARILIFIVDSTIVKI